MRHLRTAVIMMCGVMYVFCMFKWNTEIHIKNSVKHGFEPNWPELLFKALLVSGVMASLLIGLIGALASFFRGDL